MNVTVDSLHALLQRMIRSGLIDEDDGVEARDEVHEEIAIGYGFAECSRCRLAHVVR